ncbi:unnamed protein product [Chironomus riparius]|uniref:FYVE-type domain-containing protein n=1 Tax=Chironomus riparius TaxID=315576 RepID=A0A9N9WTC5_9DIPT|nr:unnamed protein product [Chironomus riparius]
MMDEFFEYWEILPQASNYESIGQEIVRYKRNLQDPDVSSMDLSDKVIEFLHEKLLECPYPTNQIILHIIDSKDHEKNQLIEDIIFGTVNKLIDMLIENPYQLDKKFKLYNLLANIYISEDKIQKVNSDLFPVLYDLKENKHLLDHVLYFALLSRNSLTVLKLYLEYEKSRLLEKFDERSIFLKCHYQQKHWIESVLNNQHDDVIKNKFSPAFYEIITLCKMILDDQNVLNKQIVKDINVSSVMGNNYLHLCFLELSRQNTILQFLNEHSEINAALDNTKNHIMTQLLKLETPFVMENYDLILKLLNFNYENNLMQLEKLNPTNHAYTHKTEMQLFNEYMLIKLYLLKILKKDCSQETSEICMNHIRGLLKTINDGSILYQILQTVFYLIFTRYEHIRKTRLKQRSVDSFNSSSPATVFNSTDVSNVFIDSFNNQGFICSKETLEIVLNSMRLFLMSLDITEAYKNCDEALKAKFTKLLRNVDIGLWKLSVIVKNDDKKEVELEKSDEWLIIHDETLKSIIIAESDEEKIDSSRKPPRKKLRKRSKMSDTSDKSHEKDSRDKDIESLYAAENSQHSAINLIVLENRKFENFIAKMLMSPESLVALCIKNNDDENAFKIIKDYNLKDRAVEQEYKMMKNYQETLKSFELIVAEYIKAYEYTVAGFNVGKIRYGSSATFELYRLTSMLERFSLPKYNLLNQNDDILDKLIVQLPNLQIYKQDHLKVAVIMDLMISISSEFEITKAAANCISSYCELKLNGHVDYYITFLKKIVGMINTCQTDDTPIPLKTLINNEVFSFDTLAFKIQKDNRDQLINLMKINIATMNDEPTLQNIASKMNNFNSDINFFDRVLTNVKNIRNIIKYVTNEYLNINEIIKDLNIYELIGKIIFDNQLHADSLETESNSVNLNLLHAIAIAGGTEFMSPLWMSARSDNESSQNVKKELKYFNISNTTILYYIKKSGSFLVAYLIKEIQKFNYQSLKYDEPNFFDRLKQLESIEILKQIYGYNSTIAAINYDFIDMNLLLDEIKNLNENGKLMMLSFVNERNVHRNKTKFNELKDDLIETLMDRNSGNVEDLLKKIGNVNKFNELLLKHIKKISSDEELEALLTWSLCAKNQKIIQDIQRKELEEWLKKIKIYRQILKLFRESKANNDITWINILGMAENDTSVLINFLINEFTDLDLCNDLLKFHPLQERNEKVYQIFIEALNKCGFNEQHDTLFKIIQNYSGKYLVDFYEYSLDYIHNMKSMEQILDYLINSNSTNHVLYQKFQISCIIINHLDINDVQLWTLSPYPLIIIEQLLMNSKIDSLNEIVKELRKLLNNQPSCNLCNTTSKDCQIGETLVYDFNAFHNGYRISNDCLDFLFKIYAAKALDFQIIDIPSQNNPSLHSGTQTSDIVQAHQMPKDIPSKDMWVKDNEAVFCMCCKKSKFSLLNRRHHCRRCGNVICGECSRKRVLLPDKYNDLMVRCCDECYAQMETIKRKLEHGSSHDKSRSADIQIEWKLTGDNDTDQMIRDEFTFEYSPNVGRCIAIICLHTINDEFIDFLLLHCRRLELLLHPIKGRINPEIDVILVGSMLKYLAKTAKLFGDSGESNIIIEQIDIILKIAESDCDSILSKATFSGVNNNLSTRDIINELIKLENWKLALDLSVKSVRTAIPGVFSAWAISLIKGGNYKLARDKIALALQPVTGNTPKDNEEFMDALNGIIPINNATFVFKRLIKTPKLLCEILEVIDSSVPKHFDAALMTSFHWNSSSPKASPKVNSNSMDYLKKMMDGDYGSPKRKVTDIFEWDRTELTKSAYFIESMYYLVNYGSNGDILEFFMKNNLIKFAIRYTLIQKIPSEMFIQFIIIPIIRSGRLIDFINALKQIDGNFIISKSYIDALCKYLERKKSLQVLYKVQLLIDDNIRAAITSLKIYLNGAGNFIELVENTRHLIDAKNLLQIELEHVENGLSTNRNEIHLKWDIKTINAQINIIMLQLEVTKFLASCEINGNSTLDVIPKLFADKISLKTLFGKSNEKSQVAILLLICGRIESSFGLCYRIIQECSLNAFKIYSTCIKYLAHDLKRLIEVEKLINCIKTNENATDPEIDKMCDELISMAIEISYNQYEADAKVQIDSLIKFISSKTMKIQCYINSNQLKTAFVHSAALNNLDYINRIYKLAVSTRQDNVKNLCEKKLNKGMDSSGSENMFG